MLGVITVDSLLVAAIAGNIIPAIATANAMISGLVVLMAFRVLAEEFDKCQKIYLRPKSVLTKTVLDANGTFEPANPNCIVCSPQPYVTVCVNVDGMTVKEFETEILKKDLNMVAPDVILDGKGVFVISSEEGETEANNDKKLSELGIVDGSLLKVDDFLQNYNLTIGITHYVAKEKNDPLFKIVGNREELKAKEETVENGKQNGIPATPSEETVNLELSDPEEGTSSSKRRKLDVKEDSDDDCVMTEDPDY